MIVNHVVDRKTIELITGRRKQNSWLETYLPALEKELTKKGISVVIDGKNCYDLLHIHLPLFLSERLILQNTIGGIAQAAGSRYIRPVQEYLPKQIAGIKRVPVVFHGHATEDSFTGGPILKRFVRGRLARFAKKADVIICPSEYAASYYRKHVPKIRRVKIANGTDLKKYAYSKKKGAEFRRRHGFTKEDQIVTCVAGISQRKGIHDFIQAAREVPDATFMWIGTEYTDNNLLKRYKPVHLHNMPKNGYFPGWIDDIPGALSASDVFLFPSKQEICPLALVEAAACSRPIVCRDIPVFRELLEPGESCVTARWNFSRPVLRMLDDKECRKKLGRNAAKAARRSHDIGKTTRGLVEVYEQLLRR